MPSDFAMETLGTKIQVAIGEFISDHLSPLDINIWSFMNNYQANFPTHWWLTIGSMLSLHLAETKWKLQFMDLSLSIY
jgi:hypothetical protein